MANLTKQFGKVTELAAYYDEARKLERHHRAKSRRQYHPASLKRLNVAKRRLKKAVGKL